MVYTSEILFLTKEGKDKFDSEKDKIRLQYEKEHKEHKVVKSKVSK
jgi:hypothetical protein